MNKNAVDYTLYLCTDRDLMSTKTIEESVELALKGGVTLVQLREKDCSSKEFYEIARRVKAITKKYGVPLIINDRVDIALAVNAEGVHIGQEDLPCSVVREIIGKDKIVGVSARSYEEAMTALEDGADYLGVGAMYSTSTKTDAEIVTMDELERIRRAVNIPIVVIGGINEKTIPNFKNKGIDGLAVVSAIVAKEDITEAAKNLLKLFKED